MNPFLRVLLGSGRLPDRIRAELAASDVVLIEEGLTGSVTYRRYRAPGEYSSWRKEAVAGSVAVGANRLVVWAGRFKHIDVPLDHPVRATIEIRADRPDRVCFAYDAGTTNPSRSGRVEVRLRTPQAARTAQLLTR
ncbi:hypothetical protein RB614_41675 [Phytohabitans sp. ZYX-F-186]|uniref:Uncharacterized protein n=1 Tax=Phytohabitans maris TaxID=3071409 RepID=A0ABU0ZVP6_9ACTN|nr:hypothetical protein [Phytohabitans sp. ZYX-F-186]MDQ7911018.1 hypothetical protein [Phytohabitans sp. ZYX-F-186]